ncbi:MAG: glycosyltransferase family 39 protein, partial [Anaerolineales bacterium]
MEQSLTAQSDTGHPSQVGQRLSRLAPALLTLASVAGWVAVELGHLDFFSFEDDEGTFLLTARAVYDGHALYREVWFNYLSGLMNLLVLVFRVGGVSLTGPRALMVVLTAITMLLASRIARRAFGRWAGALTALLLVLVPAVSSMGRSVMAEIPATVCGALAILAL